jgi:hypothetical protein|tara:strand:- start:537 stop:1739 length:1203 start_codon:yes stop_codon:yes gene_type:complete
MNLLQDVITYVRRLIKTPSNSSITDELIIDYLNRFLINDVDARIQLFDFKTKYQFQTQPGVDQYNMPLYDIQISPSTSNQSVNFYPVYQGFVGPAYIGGVQCGFETEKDKFFSVWPKVVQQSFVAAIGDGGATYTFQIPFIGPQVSPPNPPFNAILRGHVDITGIVATNLNIDPPIATTTTNYIATIPTTSVDSAVFITSIDSTGNKIVVQDSGEFLDTNINLGLLMEPGKAPYGNQALPGGYSATSNVINYLTGEITVTFPTAVPSGNNINVQCYFFQTGLPRSILFYNNCLILRSPPAQSYTVELDAYLSPAAFLNTSSALPFGYMAEYLSLGAARKILSDTGDAEQLAFYEPRFLEQESLVHIRSQRQWTATRTKTLYSQNNTSALSAMSNFSGSSY